jgi:hypothetical protein
MGRSHQPVHHAWCRSMPSATAGWSRTPNSGICPLPPGTGLSGRSGQAPRPPAGRHRDGSSGMRAISSPGFASRSARVGGLPPHQAAPPGPTRILQSGPQAVYLLADVFWFQHAVPDAVDQSWWSCRAHAAVRSPVRLGAVRRLDGPARRPAGSPAAPDRTGQVQIALGLQRRRRVGGVHQSTLRRDLGCITCRGRARVGGA